MLSQSINQPVAVLRKHSLHRSDKQAHFFPKLQVFIHEPKKSCGYIKVPRRFHMGPYYLDFNELQRLAGAS